MYVSHDTFKQPDDLAATVWRYMDLPKLIDLLARRELFFARSDKLGDPYEGSYPRAAIEVRRQQWLSAGKSPAEAAAMQGALATFPQWAKGLAQCVAINCWHRNERESAAMWSVYLRSNDGIVIRTSYQRLRDAFTGDQRVLVGMVTYLDYDSDSLPPWDVNLLAPFVHKRKSYEHEHEARALVAKTDAIDWKQKGAAPPFADGIRVAVDVDVLVGQIRVAPQASPWFLESVQSLVKQYGYGIEVTSSEMLGEPLY